MRNVMKDVRIGDGSYKAISHTIKKGFVQNRNIKRDVRKIFRMFLKKTKNILFSSLNIILRNNMLLFRPFEIE